MHIERFSLGDFETNCYVVRAQPDRKECTIIDPGFDPEPMLDFLGEHKLRPERVLLTHGHCDHIAGLSALRGLFPDVLVGIGKEDGGMLTDSQQNLAMMMGVKLDLPGADELYEHQEIIKTSGLVFRVLSTPGHTLGGVCYYAEEDGVVFSGDSLFADAIGRHDFPGGNLQQLLQGIREELFRLPEITSVYPGHGPATTIGQEKKTNPFFQ